MSKPTMKFSMWGNEIGTGRDLIRKAQIALEGAGQERESKELRYQAAAAGFSFHKCLQLLVGFVKVVSDDIPQPEERKVKS